MGLQLGLLGLLGLQGLQPMSVLWGCQSWWLCANT